MCILCVIQKWSRKIATMLPWLVIPMIGLWLLSQFLPPAFRFEITSPRLACVFVLLITLFWYEILMPQLSSWQVRRIARLRERKRLEAIEMQKLRKTATRRCRNCLTPYRDQNPPGGRFMCSYCGHISRRPVLDLPVSPHVSRISSSGIFKDLVGKGGKIWSDNNWTCGQDWLENGCNWVNLSFSGQSSYRKKNRGSFFNGSNDHFFSAIFLGIMWLLRKIFRFSSVKDDTSADARRGPTKQGENEVNNESRTEKARRKAEEKKQARLEREQLEEEERKQREEVARLVEERRKLRAVKSVTENDQNKPSPRSKNEKREPGRKLQDRKKEKDRGSSKSSSDVDELEKRAGKEIEKNRKGEIDHHELRKSGPRYLDRGNFFPSSRTFSEGGFFGKGTSTNTSISNVREHRSSTSLDNVKITVTKRDFVPPERAHGKSSANTDDQKHTSPARFESQPNPAPKRSWKQLFTRSSPTTSITTATVISTPNGNLQTEAQSPIAPVYPLTHGFDNPITSGSPGPLPDFLYGRPNIIPGLQLSSNSSILEGPDDFEDPCYVPDPTSLIGPVSESLDNFQLDLDFVPKVNKPSPIESPMSRGKTDFPPEDPRSGNEKGWQMWGSSPLGLDDGLPRWYFSELNGLKNNAIKSQPDTVFMDATSDEPWALRASYGSIPSNSNQLSVKPNGGPSQNNLVYGSVWAKEESADGACVEGISNMGRVYSTPDVHSLWSYE